MRHIQGVHVAVRGETDGSGVQQYGEHPVAEDPSLWADGTPENCRLGGRFTSSVSQVAIRKSLAQESEPAEVAIHFLQDFDWHDATAVRVQIHVSDNRGSHKDLQVDLPKHTIETEPFLVHKLPSLPLPRQPNTKSSLLWKIYSHEADQGSITVFIARGKWVASRDQSDAARRKTRDTMGLSGGAKKVLPTATRFARLTNKSGTWLCFEFQVRPKGYIFSRVVQLGDKRVTRTQEQQPEHRDSVVQKAHSFKTPSRSVPGAASPSLGLHRTTVATPKPTLETSSIAPSPIESQGKTVQKPITNAPATSNSHVDPLTQPSKNPTMLPKAGRKRTASAADLNATAPAPMSGQSHDIGRSPAGELRGRTNPARVAADSSSGTGPLESADPVASSYCSRRIVIDLTDDDVPIKTEAVPQAETTQPLEAQGTGDDDDEQDLQLELRAIRIEQRLRTLMKQKQKSKQVKVKTEEP